MAIPNNYIDKIKNKDSGESRVISPAADKVRVDNEHFEGTDLDEVLDEVAQAIEEAGSGDGTVTGVKVGSTTYEPTDGVVDLSTPFGAKVDKNGTDSLMTAAEHTKLQNLPTADQLTQQLGNKANDNAVVKSISVNGGEAQTPTQGNVNIVVSEGSGNVSVSEPDPADGTFTIHVGDTNYVINLNHTHPEYAPLVHTHSQYAQVQVVNGESNLPSTLDPKTIYGVKADGVDELEMVVIGGYKFYGGGGGAPGQPVLMRPTAGSTITFEGVDNGYSGNVLDPKSVQVYIKARNITQPISVSVSGTGFSIENSVNQISAADAIAGVNINVLFDGSANSQGGSLLLQSTELGQVPKAFDLSVEYVTYELLEGVGLDGRQYMETDYMINPDTEISMGVKFTPNGNTRLQGTKSQLLEGRTLATTGSGVLGVYFGENGSGNNAGTYLLNIATDGNVKPGSTYQQLKFHTANTPDDTFCGDNLTFVYAKNGSANTASFNGKSVTCVRQQRTAERGMRIGSTYYDNSIVDAFDIKIRSLVITENGTTVRNFIPLKRGGTEIGLYDTVNDTFHTSETDTPLNEFPITSNNS